MNQPVTASSTASDSDPANAVDGLAFTNWTAGDEERPSLTVKLGADVNFRRVLLKQTARRAIRRVRLQTSGDGVNFVDVFRAPRELE